MAKKYEVRVSDHIQVPVEGTIKNDEGQDQAIKFKLRCKRLPAAELRSDLSDGDRPAQEFMKKVTDGWTGQDIVLDPDTKQPAEFCADALDALLDVAGIASMSFQSYLKEVGAKAKNS